MRASAQGRPYEADTWVGVVAAIVLRTGARVRYDERQEAARQLSKGVTVVLTGGILVKPEGARE